MIENYMVLEDEPEKVYRCEKCGALLTEDEIAGGLNNCSICEAEILTDDEFCPPN